MSLVTIIAQVILAPEALHVILAALVALQAWIVRRLYAMDKKLALLALRMGASTADDDD